MFDTRKAIESNPYVKSLLKGSSTEYQLVDHLVFYGFSELEATMIAGLRLDYQDDSFVW